MTPNNTTKIVTLLAVLIVSAVMSGCIESDTMETATVVTWKNNAIIEPTVVEEVVIAVPESKIVKVTSSSSEYVHKPSPEPTVTVTPEPTPIAIVPATTPTPTVIAQEKSNKDYKVRLSIDRSKPEWNEKRLYLREIRDINGRYDHLIAQRFTNNGLHVSDHVYLQYIIIFMDDQLIAAFKPNIVRGNIGFDIETPMIITLPDDVNISGKIKIIGTFDFLEIGPNGENLFAPGCDGDYLLSCGGLGWQPGTTEEKAAESEEEWIYYN